MIGGSLRIDTEQSAQTYKIDIILVVMVLIIVSCAANRSCDVNIDMRNAELSARNNRLPIFDNEKLGRHY